MPQQCIFSPLGELTLSEEDGAIVALDWGQGGFLEDSPLLTEAANQLRAYFTGALKSFDLPLKPHGTTHMIRVWNELQAIPYGQVRTYGEMAETIGSAPRAIGGACGRNPIPIIIPCHRVIASNGGLGGYSGDGGVTDKKFLLKLEGREV